MRYIAADGLVFRSDNQAVVLNLPGAGPEAAEAAALALNDALAEGRLEVAGELAERAQRIVATGGRVAS